MEEEFIRNQERLKPQEEKQEVQHHAHCPLGLMLLTIAACNAMLGYLTTDVTYLVYTYCEIDIIITLSGSMKVSFTNRGFL